MHFSTLLSTILTTIAVTSQAVNASALPRDDQKVAAAWYTGWHSDGTPSFPLSQVSWGKYTHMTFAFAETTPDVTRLSMDGSNEGLLPEFVETAHNNGVKALVSIGGWSGSRWWSSNVESAENRAAFVNTVIELVEKYNLDGLDFDWEAPNSEGAGNGYSPKDTANFLEFLNLLRQHPTGSRLTLTAATQTVPFIGEDGNPSQDVSRFAWYLDWIAIMNYDVWGSWNPVVGPNAPLDDTCASGDRQAGSAVSSVRRWAEAGMPYNKIVLGVASYGHSFLVSEEEAFRDRPNNLLRPFPRYYAIPYGDAWGGGQGTYDYWAIVTEGYVNEDGSPKYGMGHRHDHCSDTPFVYNPATNIFISYDDPRSFAAKGRFIRSNGLRGFSMWEAGGDYQNRLLNSIRDAAWY
ncbi:endochitinase [Cyathus striatus]|nr:endochitinase [Cyathus striatus]